MRDVGYEEDPVFSDCEFEREAKKFAHTHKMKSPVFIEISDGDTRKKQKSAKKTLVAKPVKKVQFKKEKEVSISEVDFTINLSPAL